MKWLSVFISMLILAVSGSAQYEFIMDPQQLPAGHGTPVLTVCILFGLPQDPVCAEVEFQLDSLSGFYRGMADIVCGIGWVSSFEARMECACVLQSVILYPAPFTLPIFCGPLHPVATNVTDLFAWEMCTCPIADLSIEVQGNQVQLAWSSANGQPDYRIDGYEDPWTPEGSGSTLAVTADTSIVFPMDTELPTFFRVTCIYP